MSSAVYYEQGDLVEVQIVGQVGSQLAMVVQHFYMKTGPVFITDLAAELNVGWISPLRGITSVSYQWLYYNARRVLPDVGEYTQYPTLFQLGQRNSGTLPYQCGVLWAKQHRGDTPHVKGRVYHPGTSGVEWINGNWTSNFVAANQAAITSIMARYKQDGFSFAMWHVPTYNGNEVDDSFAVDTVRMRMQPGTRRTRRPHY